MPDSCTQKFSVGDKVVLRSSNPGYDGAVFEVENLCNGRDYYSCRMLSNSRGGLRKGNEYTLTEGDMHLRTYCMFAPTMSDQLNIGGKHDNS